MVGDLGFEPRYYVETGLQPVGINHSPNHPKSHFYTFRIPNLLDEKLPRKFEWIRIMAFVWQAIQGRTTADTSR